MSEITMRVIQVQAQEHQALRTEFDELKQLVGVLATRLKDTMERLAMVQMAIAELADHMDASDDSPLEGGSVSTADIAALKDSAGG